VDAYRYAKQECEKEKAEIREAAALMRNAAALAILERDAKIAHLEDTNRRLMERIAALRPHVDDEAWASIMGKDTQT
jgi:hypothetical protein